MGFPGFAAKQEGVAGVCHRLHKTGTDIVVPVGPSPPAVDKAAVGIFIRAAGRLDYAVLTK